MHHRGEFGTDLGVVLSYIKASVDKKELKNLISSDERFKCFDREAFDVINDATDSKLRVIEKEGKIDVCTAIKEIREEGRPSGGLGRCPKNLPGGTGPLDPRDPSPGRQERKSVSFP